MSTAELLIYLCGIFTLGFAGFHILFWKLFHWKKDLKKLTLANRAIMQILNLRLIYFFLFVAFICFFYPDELLQTQLGNVLLAGISLFWLGRIIEQVIFLRINHIMIHLLTLLFALGTVLFALPLFL